MSDQSQGPGWWQASDDKWYPPDLHPDNQAPAGPPTGPEPAPTEAVPETGPPPDATQVVPEATQAMPPVGAVPGPPTAPGQVPPGGPPLAGSPGSAGGPGDEEPPRKSRKLLIGAIVVVLLLLIGGGAFALTRGGNDDNKDNAAVDTKADANTDNSDQSSASDQTEATDQSDNTDASDQTDSTDATDSSDSSDQTDNTDQSDSTDAINQDLQQALLTGADVGAGFEVDPTFENTVGNSPCGAKDVDIQVPPAGLADGLVQNVAAQQEVQNDVRQYKDGAQATKALDAFVGGFSCSNGQVGNSPAAISPATDATGKVAGADSAKAITVTSSGLTRQIVVATTGNRMVVVFSDAPSGTNPVDPAPLAATVVDRVS